MIKLNHKATALVFVLMVMISFLAVSTAIFSRSLSENKLAQRRLKSVKTLWLAEAAVQRAIKELKSNPSLSGYQGPYSLGDGEYDFQIQSIGANSYRVTANGAVPAIASFQIKRTIEVEISPDTTYLFTHAAFANSNLTISGNGETDSYDSSQGPYGSGNVGSNGDIGSNGTTEGIISLSGNATVNGDAGTGPGGTVSLTGNSTVNGTISDNNDYELPPVVIPSELSGLSDSGDLTVSANKTVEINGGDYHYSSITVSGNANLHISGDTRLYVDGDIETIGNGRITVDADVVIYTDGQITISGNGIVNNTQQPQSVLIYSTSEDSQGVKISGNGDFYGAIYAPSAGIKVTGNGDIYGSIIGEEITITGNGDIHYDEALANVSYSGNNNLIIQTWQETPNPYPL